MTGPMGSTDANSDRRSVSAETYQWGRASSSRERVRLFGNFRGPAPASFNEGVSHLWGMALIRGARP
jgi:hypothetical protein